MTLRALLGLTVLLALFGCGGGGVERNDVSGKATFAGEPIVFGEIQFIPRHSDGTEAPTGNATIRNGQFSTAQGGQGIVGGPHELRVTAYPQEPVFSEDETADVETVEPLFVNFVMTADVQPPTFDLTVPDEARGFDPNKKARRSNEP